MVNLYNGVNTNSKYKEDDFTGSIAVNCFKMYEYTQSISAMKHTHVTSLLYSPPHPLPTPALSQVRRVGLVTAPTQGAS